MVLIQETFQITLLKIIFDETFALQKFQRHQLVHCHELITMVQLRGIARTTTNI